MKGKSYTDTNRKDFECGKYKDIKAGKIKSSREGIICGASIISDRYGVEHFKFLICSFRWLISSAGCFDVFLDNQIRYIWTVRNYILTVDSSIIIFSH